MKKLLFLALLCCGCHEEPVEPAPPPVAAGSIVGTVMGPILGATQFLPGIQIQAAPECANPCGAGKVTATQSGGRYFFDNMLAETRYVVTVVLPDSLMIDATDVVSKSVTVRAKRADTVNFRIAFAPRDTLMRLEVAPADVPCWSLYPTRCLVARLLPTENRTYFFHGEIEGFNYEPGFQYIISVLRSRTPDVPADASIYRWRLVEVIEKASGAP